MDKINHENFIIDSNCFILPSKDFYHFNIVPTFWDCLTENHNSKYLHIIDSVQKEVCHEVDEKNKDDIQKWIENKFNGNVIKTEDPVILKNYTKVLNYVQQCNFYKESAFHEWSNINIADPWLIATAMKFDYTIVTFEKADNIQVKNKLKRAKIPNVCDHFGVKYCTLFNMMSRLNIKI